MRFTLAPESAKAFIEVEFLNSQGKVNLPGSPIFLLAILILCHKTQFVKHDGGWFFQLLLVFITSLANVESLVIYFNNGALIDRDCTCSMNFFCFGSNGFLMARDG